MIKKLLYFALFARLDKPLLNACREDAKKLCMTEFEEEQKAEHKPHGAVVSCLYHHIFSEDGEEKVSRVIPLSSYLL
jgi:hypothetical protein